MINVSTKKIRSRGFAGPSFESWSEAFTWADTYLRKGAEVSIVDTESTEFVSYRKAS